MQIAKRIFVLGRKCGSCKAVDLIEKRSKKQKEKIGDTFLSASGGSTFVLCHWRSQKKKKKKLKGEVAF